MPLTSGTLLDEKTSEALNVDCLSLGALCSIGGAGTPDAMRGGRRGNVANDDERRRPTLHHQQYPLQGRLYARV